MFGSRLHGTVFSLAVALPSKINGPASFLGVIGFSTGSCALLCSGDSLPRLASPEMRPGSEMAMGAVRRVISARELGRAPSCMVESLRALASAIVVGKGRLLWGRLLAFGPVKVEKSTRFITAKVGFSFSR